MEVLIAVINDGIVLAAGSDVANTLEEGENYKSITTEPLWQIDNVPLIMWRSQNIAVRF